MATQDDFIKTALRIPRALHAGIQAAAEQGGRSMNAEIIGRLQDSLKVDVSKVIIERLTSREAQLLDASEKQLDLLWDMVRRADAALRRCSAVIEKSSAWEEDADLERDVGVLLELISAISVHRRQSGG